MARSWSFSASASQNRRSMRRYLRSKVHPKGCNWLAKIPTVLYFLDFAHAPSKVQATTQALKEKYDDRKLTACLELHTYSSLNKKFISNYQDTLNAADQACIYFNPNNQKQQGENKIMVVDVENAFNFIQLNVFTEISELEKFLLGQSWDSHNLLMMSSGNFGNLDLKSLAQKITN